MYDELLITLKKINNKSERPIQEAIIESILALVIKYPLDDERKKCQDQIEIVLSQNFRDD